MAQFDIFHHLVDKIPARTIEAESLSIDKDHQAAVFYITGDVVAIVMLSSTMSVVKRK